MMVNRSFLRIVRRNSSCSNSSRNIMLRCYVQKGGLMTKKMGSAPISTTAGKAWFTSSSSLSSSSSSFVKPYFSSATDQMSITIRYKSTAPVTSTTTATTTNESTTIVHDMFCRQCEQTADHYACTRIGTCGKTSETAACQDALMQMIRNVSSMCVQARTQEGKTAEAEEKLEEVLHRANAWTLQATFATLTNVNFSEERIAEYFREGQDLHHELIFHLDTDFLSTGTIPTNFQSVDEIDEYGHRVSIPIRATQMNNEDAFALNELATYGLKGACAYAMHAYQLVGEENFDHSIVSSIHEAYATLDDLQTSNAVETMLATTLRVGEITTQVLKMLDDSHATKLGVPEPSQVRTTAVQGKCILVSGHDMMDLYELLKQTDGTGINVYTHGEMLPAHAYPKLRQFKHLVGNYGTAWQNQKFEFALFPGPIIVTTNCILEPRRKYKHRLYSMNEVGVDGVQHIGTDRNFGPVIEQALSDECKGFVRTIEPSKYVTTGYNHRTVVPLVDTILQLIESKQLSHVFVIGGCDGSQWDRSYFTTLAEETPQDSLILTMGCAKNRIIHSEKLENAMLGDTGLPRVLDMGQCNDSYSAVVLALELAKALDCSVNDLPLSLAVSHLEQKAAAVLLSLLSLGVHNIRLGPSLPAYLTPNVLSMLKKEYNLTGVSDVHTDLAAMIEKSSAKAAPF